MPASEYENHPFLSMGEWPNRNSLILGSFPIYSLTQPENELKNQLMNKNRDFQFFYGSRRNRFWQWYKTYLDNTVDPCNTVSIQNSLSIHNISISDVISGCFRKDYSALDSDLTRKTWNREGISNLLTGETSRVVCTSKQVIKWVDDSITDKRIFKRNYTRESQIQSQLLTGITDINTDQGIVRVYDSPTLAKTVEIIATPTPGGNTYRKLDCFGYNQHFGITNTVFLEGYLLKTFMWLNFRIDL